MKKFFKMLTLMLVVATIAAISVTSLAACGGNEIKQVDKYEYSGKLTVATEAQFAPYEYKENGVYKGFDIELITMIAKNLGFEGIEVKDMAFDSVVSTVVGNPYAVGIAAMTINPTRLNSVDFSDKYLSEAYQVLIVEKSNTDYDACKTADDVLKVLKEKKPTINYAMSQTGQYYVEGNPAMKFPGVEAGQKASQQTAPNVISAIKNGAVGVLDNGVAEESCEKNNLKYIDIPLTFENYGIAINKSNNQLLKDINAQIAKLDADGTIDALTAKYKISAVK